MLNEVKHLLRMTGNPRFIARRRSFAIALQKSPMDRITNVPDLLNVYNDKLLLKYNLL
jgi:hypothetical protein